MEKGGGGVAMGSFVEEGSRRKQNGNRHQTRERFEDSNKEKDETAYIFELYLQYQPLNSCLALILVYIIRCCLLLCSKTTSNSYIEYIHRMSI